MNFRRMRRSVLIAPGSAGLIAALCKRAAFGVSGLLVNGLRES
jgi:hypothetical protein